MGGFMNTIEQYQEQHVKFIEALTPYNNKVKVKKTIRKLKSGPTWYLHVVCHTEVRDVVRNLALSFFPHIKLTSCANGPLICKFTLATKII